MGRSKDKQTPPITEEHEIQPKIIELLSGRVDLAPPRSRRIFTNRNLRLDKIEWIGFDMDYTLVRYHKQPMELLMYQKAFEKLLSRGNVPNLENADRTLFQYDPQRIVRGALIDKETGNVFQMDRHRHVGTAFHGHRLLSKQERRHYRNEPLGLGDSNRFRLIDTLFGIPEACLFCDLVEWLKTQPDAQPVNYYKLYDEVRESTDLAHADKSIHGVIQNDFDKYVVRDPQVGEMLERLKVSGKRLFLLTNSGWEFTNEVMSYLLESYTERNPDSPWHELFDLVLVRACKPRFFTQNNPFELLDLQGNSLGETMDLKKHRFARFGNQESLNRTLGVAGDLVLYAGDHIYGDILKPKKSSTWRNMLIIEELEEELIQLEHMSGLQTQKEELENRRQRLDAEWTYHKLLLEKLQKNHPEGSSEQKETISLKESAIINAIRKTERTLKRLKKELEQLNEKIGELREKLKKHFNPNWGMLFRQGHEYSHLGEQIRTYACLYASRVTNLLFYSPNQYFRSPSPSLPHELHEMQKAVSNTDF